MEGSVDGWSVISGGKPFLPVASVEKNVYTISPVAIKATAYRTIPNMYKGFLNRNLRKRQNSQNFNFPGILEIPKVALEEAVVNALIHRDYLIDSSVRVFIFDNRVEIISPGKLPNTATIETIKVGIQIVRNPILVSFVPKLRTCHKDMSLQTYR